MADRDKHTEPDGHGQRRRRTDLKGPTAPDLYPGSRSTLGRALDLGVRLRELDAEDAPSVEAHEKDGSAKMQAEEIDTTPPSRRGAKRRDDVAVIVDGDDLDDLEDRYRLLRELRGLGRCVGLEG